MTVEFDNLTAYCGIYCGDCIHYRNSHSQLASELRNKLEQVDFARYAEIKSPFGKELSPIYEGITGFD